MSIFIFATMAVMNVGVLLEAGLDHDSRNLLFEARG